MSSENTHNNGRIKWNILLEAITKKEMRSKEYPFETQYEWFVDEKKMDYFCKNIIDVLKNYENTYKEEIPFDLNPTQWDSANCFGSSGGQTCYRDSLLGTYIQLNLILLNSYLNDIPIFFNIDIVWIMEGDGDLQPCEYITSRFKKICPLVFERKQKGLNEIKNVKKLSKESIEEVRDFLKEIFICLIALYRNKEHRQYVSDHHISEMIEWLYKLKSI